MSLLPSQYLTMIHLPLITLIYSGMLLSTASAWLPFATYPDYSGQSTKTKRTQLASVVDSFVNVAEAAPRGIATMDEWANMCGVQRSDGFQLTLTHDNDDQVDPLHQDVFAMTTQDIPAQSPVLYVPNEMIFSSQQAKQECGTFEASEKLLKSLNVLDKSDQFYLMVKILVEYQKGSESPWFPWLNGLPRYFSNGASMTDFCFECLPPLMASLAMNERNTLRAFLSSATQLPNHVISDELKANSDIVTWAFQIVFTRSFFHVTNPDDGTGDWRLVPMADMLNHGSRETEVALNYDDDGNCWVQSTRDIAAGSPLRMQYADPTNPSFLLARYGFLDETSEATFCKYMIPHETKEIKEMGYAPHKMLFYKDTGDISPEVWDVLLFQILSSTNAAKRRQLYQAHLNGDQDTKLAMHQQYYPQTAEKLLDHIDTFLADLEKLPSKLQGADIQQHPRLPLIWRHNEFVKRTFLAVRDRYF